MIPLVFMGAIVGVILNQYLPSLATFIILIAINIWNIPRLVTIFRGEESQGEDYFKTNPFYYNNFIRVFEQLIKLYLVYVAIVVLMITGLLGFSVCSPLYWVFEGLIFVLALAFF